MQIHLVVGRAAAVFIGCLWGATMAQAIEVIGPVASSPAAQSAAGIGAAVPSLIVAPVNERDLVSLVGNTHPLATAAVDQGPVAANVRFERMILVLRRSAEQDRALAAYSERQYDPSSQDYHHWLSPEGFGRLYGPNNQDIAAVTQWLDSHGFTIGQVGNGRISIEFSGTAAEIESAFHMQMHRYLVDGVQHIANDRDPQIPAALAPVIEGLASLNDFRPRLTNTWGGHVKRDPATGKFIPIELPAPASSPKSGVQPLLGYIGTNGLLHEEVTPYDFAAIYNLLPLWKADKPVTGAGVPVAIAAGSDVTLSDVATFRKSFGLPAKAPTTFHNGKDPGKTGDQAENTEDVEMVGSSAPDADITLVVSAATATTDGFELSASYVVDHGFAPILTVSYGVCELELGAAQNAFWSKLWQQGSSEGISIFVAAGDSGSATCANHNATPPNVVGVNGLQVSGVASPPFVTAVGGTDFTWSYSANDASTYWNSTNAANGSSAKGHIPEIPWDTTCANPLLLSFETTKSGERFGSNEALCNYALVEGPQALLVTEGGGGGVSHCTSPRGTTGDTCAGGYAKPSWQTGTGVPSDGKRDLPDVALFASFGWNSNVVNGSAILICYTGGGYPCDYTSRSEIVYSENGGTSAASPYMAGVMALVLQTTGTVQGLANPTLYKLASKEELSSCNSSTVAKGNDCVFYDVTKGTNAPPCLTGDLDCLTHTAGDEIGILSGYSATSGYDRASGLGSLNVANLVDKWASAAPTPTVEVSPSSLTFASTKVGKTSASQTVTVKNTGKVAVTIADGGITLSGADASSFGGTTDCTTILALGASCTIKLALVPAKAGSLTATLSIADNAAGSPQKVILKGSGTAADASPTVSLLPREPTFALAGPAPLPRPGR